MVHLRIVAPPALAEQAYEAVLRHPSALNVVRLPRASERPAGDLILCDVASEDTSIVVEELRRLGPEFGPLAGLCVALVQRRPKLAGRSLTALAVGFPLAILASYLLTTLLRAVGSAPDTLSEADHPATLFIAHPNEYSALVAVLAGLAGTLSLSTAKSGAIVGVLISVATIPTAANVGVAAAYGDGSEVGGRRRAARREPRLHRHGGRRHSRPSTRRVRAPAPPDATGRRRLQPGVARLRPSSDVAGGRIRRSRRLAVFEYCPARRSLASLASDAPDASGATREWKL
jgi:uncharacterized hydrophobic protein (TIGR00271 family)